MLDEALRHDLGHDLIRVVDALAALVSERDNPSRDTAGASGLGQLSGLSAEAPLWLESSRPEHEDGRGVIAAAFGNGLSWRGTLAGKDVYCPPPGLTGTQIMATFERFVRDNPDIAERPYGDAMAATLSREFPCQAR